MDCSIIILNYKTPGLLKQCLRGLLHAQLKFSYEIIVVDNASHDESVEMVQEDFPNVTLIAASANRGFAAGNNLGIRVAKGEYILIMTPDLAVFPGVLEQLLEYSKAHPDVGVVAPQLRNPDGSIQVSTYRFPNRWIPILRRTPLGKLPWGRRILRHYLMADWDRTSTRPVEWVLGACMLVPRSAIEKVGLLDERFFLYFEDIDWCRRFWEHGLAVVYYHEAALTHYHQRLSAESPGLTGIFSSLTRVHIMSGIRYFMKYHGRPQPKIPSV
jgi:N-acetylglucosaminyl-diphospho-decaprenol L-rhamnosyltransferase